MRQWQDHARLRRHSNTTPALDHELQSHWLCPRVCRCALYSQKRAGTQPSFERGCQSQQVLGKRLAELGRVVASEKPAEMPKTFSVGHQLPQAEEAKDRDHDDDGSDDPDDVVHCCPRGGTLGGLSGRSEGGTTVLASEPACAPTCTVIPSPASGKNMVSRWLIRPLELR